MFGKSLVIIAALCCAVTLFGRGATTPKGWNDDFKAAQAIARRSNRPILLLLTGSDWCGFCKKLKREALDKSDFKRFAADRLVLVYADSPNKVSLPPELAAQNKRLSAQFKVRGVPCTVILAPDGTELGRISGCPRNPKDYLRQIKKIVGKTPQAPAKAAPQAE